MFIITDTDPQGKPENGRGADLRTGQSERVLDKTGDGPLPAVNGGVRFALANFCRGTALPSRPPTIIAAILTAQESRPTANLGHARRELPRCFDAPASPSCRLARHLRSIRPPPSNHGSGKCLPPKRSRRYHAVQRGSPVTSRLHSPGRGIRGSVRASFGSGLRSHFLTGGQSRRTHRTGCPENGPTARQPPHRGRDGAFLSQGQAPRRAGRSDRSGGGWRRLRRARRRGKGTRGSVREVVVSVR